MRSTPFIEELRTAVSPVKETDLPQVVQFWASRTACLNHDRITDAIREAAEKGEFRRSRIPFLGRHIKGSIPLEFSCDLLGDALYRLSHQIQENADLLKELGFTPSHSNTVLTLTAPITVTPHGRELVGGEFIHTYSFSLACRMMLRTLEGSLKITTKHRPRFRIELRRRVDAPSCFVRSGTKFKNDSIGGYPASVHVFYSVRF